MKNELFAKLLEHKKIKEVPLSYVIIVFSAIQEIQEQEKATQKQMDRG